MPLAQQSFSLRNRSILLLILGLVASSTDLFAANVAPKFRGGADVVLLEDSPAQMIPNWATSISPGGADEQSQQLTFLVSNSNNSIFEEQPEISPAGTLHFVPAKEAFGTAVVRVLLQDDGGTEGGGRNTSPSFSFLITIRPINDPPMFIAGPDLAVNEDSGDQTFAGWATERSVGPTNEALQRLTFVLAPRNPELFAKQPTVNSAGTLTFTPARNAFGDTAVTIFAADSGGVANGGRNASETATFVISIRPVNDAPSMARIPDVLVPEDAPAQTNLNWVKLIAAGPTNESEQSLAISITNDNSALFEVQPVVGLDGKLTFTPARDSYGVANVTVKLSDDGGRADGGADTSLPQTFKITVQAVNDPPTFGGGPDQTVLEDSGARSVPNWATNITVGSPKEVADQRVSGFIVTNDNAALFAGQPAVDLAGTLTFTPSPDAFGTALISVRLKDTGPADSGLNLSAPHNFRINVEAVNDPPRISPLTNITVWEDVGRVVRSNWAKGIYTGPTNERSQGLTITTITTNTALFSVQPVVETNGALSFATAPDANGSATVTVTLKDSGGTNFKGDDTTVARFDIVIEPVNDRPSFSKGMDQAVVTGVGSQRLVNWATNISAGPAEERVDQKVIGFFVTNSNPTLFLQPPAISTDGTLTYAPHPASIGTATVRVQAKDDGGTNHSGLDLGTNQTFTITVTPALDPPSFAVGTNVTVNEDSGPKTVAGWARQIRIGPTNLPGLKLSFKTAAADPKLFSSQPAMDPAGTLTFTPATNAFGETTVSISAAHSGSRATGGIQVSSTNTFTITILPVNDPPSFSRVPTNVAVMEDAGRLVFTNWARGLRAGPTNETSQKLSFWLTNDQPRLFETQPAIDSDGTLIFATAHDANGLANVEVKLLDDGTRERGGLDASPSQQFTIGIKPVNDPPTFHAGPDQVVLEDSGPRQVQRWATEMSVGSSWEAASQKFESFTLTNDHPELFAAGPALDLQGQLAFTPATNAFGTARVVIRAKDSGPAAEGLNLSVPYTLNITVSPVNDRPEMAAIQNLTLFEDVGRVNLTNWVRGLAAGPGNEGSQQMTLTTSAGTTNRLFTDSPSIDASGTLTFSTVPDASGKATISVTLGDDGGTNDGGKDSFRLSFEILIRPLNDPPTFTKGADQAVLNTAGLQRVSKWATDLRVGPADEVAARQRLLDFVVDVDNPAIFARLPEISADGTLTYRPAARREGIATVTVRAKDNGGTMDGGEDLSAAQTFTIRIAPPPESRATSSETPSWMSSPIGR